MSPLPTRVTATLTNAAERRSIFGRYEQRPSIIILSPSKPPSTKRVASRWNCRLPKRKWSRSAPSAEVKLFLEPGEPVAHQRGHARPAPISRFSGQGAANNQFLAALRARFSDYLRIDYKDLAVDAHRKMIDQRRLEMTRFLDEGCAQGGLTPAFVDYYRAEITYEWAEDLGRISAQLREARRTGERSHTRELLRRPRPD